MSNRGQQTEGLVEVVVNNEKQYSIWLAEKEIPSGWTKVRKSGTKEVCLKYIEEVWVGMRPLSLRKQMTSTTVSK